MLRSIIAGAALALAAFGAQAQIIKIAILGPMAFVQGEHHWAGAEMARDEINRAGGINVGGRRMQVELVRADTNEIQSVPDATNAMERVITRSIALVASGTDWISLVSARTNSICIFLPPTLTPPALLISSRAISAPAQCISPCTNAIGPRIAILIVPCAAAYVEPSARTTASKIERNM